jgi:hypothetical protein
MSTYRIVGEEFDKQAAVVSAALRNTAQAGAGVQRSLPRAVLAMLGPYSAALFIAERVVRSDVFDAELARTLHSRLLPLERMADEMLSAARQRGHFDDPDAAEPLGWLETCNEQVKDCMVAFESMLDPNLDGLMAAAMEEHRLGETSPGPAAAA